MIETLTDGLIKSLAEHFDGYSIYTEDIEQGLDPPCFLVLLNESKFERHRGDTFYLEADYSVHFFPEGDEPRRACEAITTDLQMALSTVAFGDGELIDASCVQSHVESDFMVVDAAYSRYLRKVELDQGPQVESLDLTITVKE